jgi:hypothetical protein
LEVAHGTHGRDLVKEFLDALNKGGVVTEKEEARGFEGISLGGGKADGELDIARGARPKEFTK